MSDDKRTQGGLSATTLLIAAAASAAAALVIPMIWRPGTVFAAAMTPIVVALVSEMLRRPVETVSSVRVRRTPRGTAILDRAPEEPFDPLAPPSDEDLAALPESRTAPRAEHRRRPLTGREWRIALATGLVAFVAVVAILTASELLTGEPASSGGGRTTFFGGKSSKQTSEQDEQRTAPQSDERRSETPTPTPTPTTTTEPEATPTPTTTPTATPTPAPLQVAPAEPAPTP